ncbi:MAG: hypothetical protein SGPRY_007926 [Prymnesium sp.]
MTRVTIASLVPVKSGPSIQFDDESIQEAVGARAFPVVIGKGDKQLIQYRYELALTRLTDLVENGWLRQCPPSSLDLKMMREKVIELLSRASSLSSKQKSGPGNREASPSRSDSDSDARARFDLARAMGSNGRVDAPGEKQPKRASLPVPVREMNAELVGRVQHEILKVPSADEAGQMYLNPTTARKLAAAAVAGQLKLTERLYSGFTRAAGAGGRSREGVTRRATGGVVAR